jgi:hypothetical protein
MAELNGEGKHLIGQKDAFRLAKHCELKVVAKAQRVYFIKVAPERFWIPCPVDHHLDILREKRNA